MLVDLYLIILKMLVDLYLIILKMLVDLYIPRHSSVCTTLSVQLLRPSKATVVNLVNLNYNFTILLELLTTAGTIN